MVRIATGKGVERGSDAVVVTGVGCETGEFDDMIGGCGGFIGEIRQVGRRVTVANPADDGLAAAPSDDDAVLVVLIQIGSAGERAAGWRGADGDRDAGAGGRVVLIVRGDGS